jgi:hypothetical protein
MMNGESIVLKHRAQRINYKDGIAFGDEYVNCFKKFEEIVHESIPAGDSCFILCALCFVL